MATNTNNNGSNSVSKLEHATTMAGSWLHKGNLARERGNHELAERHYAKAQKWHDEMNRLLGKA